MIGLRPVPSGRPRRTLRSVKCKDKERHMSDLIEHDASEDGLDRRGFLRCMAWAGTGLLWTVSSGVPLGMRLGGSGDAIRPAEDGLFFARSVTATSDSAKPLTPTSPPRYRRRSTG